MKNKSLIIVLLIIILVGIGSFFSGMKYQQSKWTQQNRSVNFQSGRAGQLTQRQNFRPINGEIISIDDKSLTVKLADNSSRIIFITESTIINKSEKASKEDLKIGEKIMVFGNQNTDGSLTAQNIQLNPYSQGMFNREQSNN